LKILPANQLIPNLSKEAHRAAKQATMKKLNVGSRCIALFVCITLWSVFSKAQTSAPSKAADDQVLSQPTVFPFDQLRISKMANGGESRNVVRGTLVTGEAVTLHESILPVGSVPNPPHRIQHSEFITVLDGTLAFEHDSKSERVGTGGVIYVALGTLHTLRNVGDVPAKYMVVAIGGDSVKK
jgi:mannose-6-phosphate isomerase-like protein (cupin superfamily)